MGLYVRAGSWCMGKVRYRPEREIPAEWFVPDDQVKAWCGSVRQANRLVDVGLWYRARGGYGFAWIRTENTADRSEEHTSELQSHVTSYAVFCLKKKTDVLAGLVGTAHQDLVDGGRVENR